MNIYMHMSNVLYIWAYMYTNLLNGTLYTYNFNTMLQLIEFFKAFK